MNKKNNVFDFEKLSVYQKSLDFVDFVYEITKSFPPTETYNLNSQFRRAAYSISLNIGEGSAGSRKEFIQFLTIAKRSLRECIVCISISYRRNYLSESQQSELREKLIEISKMLSGLINYLESNKAIDMMSEPEEIYESEIDHLSCYNLRTPNNELQT